MPEKAEKKFVTLQEIFDGYSAKATAKAPHEVDIIGRHDVEFTDDFTDAKGKVLIKKGHRQLVSTVNKDWYKANGVIKIHGVDKNKEAEKTSVQE